MMWLKGRTDVGTERKQLGMKVNMGLDGQLCFPKLQVAETEEKVAGDRDHEKDLQ